MVICKSMEANSLEFIAEIVEVKSKKTVSLDLEYTIKLRTDNTNALLLGTINPDQTVKVKVELSNG